MSKTMVVLCSFLFVVICLSFDLQGQNNNGWKKQLEKIQQNEMLKNKEYPQLESYIYWGEIETVNEVKQVKKKLLSYTDSYFPIVDKDSGSVELLNLEELQKREGEENVSTSTKLLSEYLDQIIQPGMHILQLTWKCHSKMYKSLCIVSDDAIVYDHIIMNLMFVKKEESHQSTQSTTIR